MSTAVPPTAPAGPSAPVVSVGPQGGTGTGTGIDTDRVVADLRRRLAVGVVLCLGLIALAVLALLHAHGGADGAVGSAGTTGSDPAWAAWLPPLVAAPVALGVALPIHRATLADLRRGVLGPDAPVSLGTLALLAWSLVPAMDPAAWPDLPHPAAGAAAGVATAALAVRYAAARARQRAEAELGVVPTPDAVVTVLRECPDGPEDVPVAIGEIVVGDLLVVAPGATVGADGVVVDGAGALDTSALTDRPDPVDVSHGDAVLAGWRNVGGRLVVRVTHPVADSGLARAAALAATVRREPSSGPAERTVTLLVLSVLAVAALTLTTRHLLGTDPAHALDAAVAVLLVACPGALVLAGPVARLACVGQAARRGVVATSLDSREAARRARRVDTVLLDRASLTDGDIGVIGVVPATGEQLEDVLAVAGALEASVTHPIARAVAAHARARVGLLPTVRHLVPLPGLGLQGSVDDRAAMIGSPRLFADHGVVLGGDLANAVLAAERDGRTPLVVAWDGRARAVVIVADTARPTAAGTVVGLRELGLDPVLLTSGNAHAARSLARRVGITTVIGEALPEDKVRVVRRLQARGHVVAVVGSDADDTDHPVLGAADLGIAVARGAVGHTPRGCGTPNTPSTPSTPGLRRPASAVTLLRTEPEALVEAVAAPRRALAINRGQRRLVVAHHAVALPLAAAGLLPPLAAGMLAAGTSVIVLAAGRLARR